MNSPGNVESTAGLLAEVDTLAKTAKAAPISVDSGLFAAQASDIVADLISAQLAQVGWGVVEGLGIDRECLAGLQQEAFQSHQAGQLTQAAIGRGAAQKVASDIRRDLTAWLDGQGAQAALFQRLSQIQHYLNRTLYLGLTHFEAHYAVYEPGAFYRPHRDSFNGRASRVVSLVLYLNDRWQPDDGGELRLFGAGGAETALVVPEAGRAVCFLSEEILHEVCTTQRTRYSIACWFRADVSENLAILR